MATKKAKVSFGPIAGVGGVPTAELFSEDTPVLSKSIQKRLSVQRTGKLPETVKDPKKKAVKKAAPKKAVKKAAPKKKKK